MNMYLVRLHNQSLPMPNHGAIRALAQAFFPQLIAIPGYSEGAY